MASQPRQTQPEGTFTTENHMELSQPLATISSTMTDHFDVNITVKSDNFTVSEIQDEGNISTDVGL
jgi:predicted double-glycine peptidase